MEYVSNPRGWTMQVLEELLEGTWYRAPLNSDWKCQSFAINGTGIRDNNTMFIAMDRDTWLKGSGNVIYNDWTDTHITVLKYAHRIAGAIVQRPIPELDPSVPQFVVANSYDVIKTLAMYARNHMSGQSVAITGTVGKSTLKQMLSHLLNDTDIIATVGNQNTRAGVPLTLTACIHNPQYCILEIAMSALWTRDGGICTWVKPHIGVVTEIGLGQVQRAKDLHTTALYKSRIFNGIQKGGYGVLYEGMVEFDTVYEEAVKYGAKPILYGDKESCDSYIKSTNRRDQLTEVHACILGEDIDYSIPLIGKAMVLNSIAALTVAKLLNIDIQTISKKFIHYVTNENVLQIKQMQMPGGKITVIDDSHNAEILSMISAFDAFKEEADNAAYGQRIGVLGRIVNLDDKAQELHESLAAPLMTVQFDKIFAHGAEMKYLLDKLPPHLIGGLYMDAERCAEAIRQYIKPNDFVLIKGSRRASDFGKIPVLLEQKLAMPSQDVSAAATTPLPNSFVCELEQNEVLISLGQDNREIDEGLGIILLVYLTVLLLSTKKLSLTDQVQISKMSAFEKKGRKSLGLELDETISVGELLAAVVVSNAPDAAIALAEYITQTTKQSALSQMKEIAARLGLKERAVQTITGRQNKNRPQRYGREDLAKVSQLLFALPPKALKYLRVTSVVHGSCMQESNSILHSVSDIIYYFCFGQYTFNAVAFVRIAGKSYTVCTYGAASAFDRDYMICDMIERIKCPEHNLQEQWHTVEPVNGVTTISIAGDTYFGEWYTAIRSKKGQDDALQHYGYSHSFEKVAPLLRSNDFNIINFEAVLSDKTVSPLQSYFTYILKGNTQETIAELKARNVHAAMLANNHFMDYGESGGQDTIRAFQENGIFTVGAGNAAEAGWPLCLSANGQQVLLFNAYWYREIRQHVSRHYAMGGQVGTACLSNAFLSGIREFRTKYPDAFIILSVHWGTDFSDDIELQKKYARLAVEAGVDLIVGHGPHIPLTHEWVDRRLVLYSIGNFVFNSNGTDYEKKKKPAYGYVTKLYFENGHIELRLYPIIVHNLKTFWQPRPVTGEEFEWILEYFHIIKKDTGYDPLGYYITYLLK